jgi:DNA-binding XRE family transcriptional regulator
MTPPEERLWVAARYRTMRERIGTQQHVAGLLGLNRTTIRRREVGESKISYEMLLAISFILEQRRRTREGEPPVKLQALAAFDETTTDKR